MTDTRIQPTTVANAATDARLTPVASPTGTPTLPTSWTPWLTILVAVAGVVASLPAFGVALPAAVTAIAGAVVAIGAALGIASPGVRKQG